jgi:hypothetical protein
MSAKPIRTADGIKASPDKLSRDLKSKDNHQATPKSRPSDKAIKLGVDSPARYYSVGSSGEAVGKCLSPALPGTQKKRSIDNPWERVAPAAPRRGFHQRECGSVCPQDSPTLKKTLHRQPLGARSPSCAKARIAPKRWRSYTGTDLDLM